MSGNGISGTPAGRPTLPKSHVEPKPSRQPRSEVDIGRGDNVTRPAVGDTIDRAQVNEEIRDARRSQGFSQENHGGDGASRLEEVVKKRKKAAEDFSRSSMDCNNNTKLHPYGDLYGQPLDKQPAGPANSPSLGVGISGKGLKNFSPSSVTCNPSASQKSKEVGSTPGVESGNKKGKSNHRISTELTLGPGPWPIMKKLSKSDVGTNCCLQIHTYHADIYIIPLMDEESKIKMESENGLEVEVEDTDEKMEKSNPKLVFKHYPDFGYYRLRKGWKVNFVARRNLKEGDKVGLHWNNDSKKFTFSVIERAPATVEQRKQLGF